MGRGILPPCPVSSAAQTSPLAIIRRVEDAGDENARLETLADEGLILRAEVFQNRLGAPVLFISADARQLAAAARLGLATRSLR
jgi:hypothetical protein